MESCKLSSFKQESRKMRLAEKRSWRHLEVRNLGLKVADNGIFSNTAPNFTRKSAIFGKKAYADGETFEQILVSIQIFRL